MGRCLLENHADEDIVRLELEIVVTILINGHGDGSFLVAASQHYGRDADFRKPIVRLETAKGRHKVLDLASQRGFARFEVALNA